MLIRETICRSRFSWSVPALDQFGASLRAQAFFALARRDGSSWTREQLLAHIDGVKSYSGLLFFYRGTTSYHVPFDALLDLGRHRALLQELAELDLPDSIPFATAWSLFLEHIHFQAGSSTAVHAMYDGEEVCVTDVSAACYLHANLSLLLLEQQGLSAGLSSLSFRSVVLEFLRAGIPQSLAGILSVTLPPEVLPCVSSDNIAAREPTSYPRGVIAPLTSVDRSSTLDLEWCPFCAFTTGSSEALQVHLSTHIPAGEISAVSYRQVLLAAQAACGLAIGRTFCFHRQVSPSVIPCCFVSFACSGCHLCRVRAQTQTSRHLFASF